MEALLILFNFLAMAYIMIWCAGVAKRGDKARYKGYLAFGDQPMERLPEEQSPYTRK